MDTLSTHNCSAENRVDDLLRPEVLQAFDRATFERDGYWVWEGILTDAARKQWTASLQKLQQMNDAILMDTEWSAIDFEARGFPPPLPKQITPEFWQRAVAVQNKCRVSSEPLSCVDICTPTGYSDREPRWSHMDSSRKALCQNTSLPDMTTLSWM